MMSSPAAQTESNDGSLVRILAIRKLLMTIRVHAFACVAGLTYGAWAIITMLWLLYEARVTLVRSDSAPGVQFQRHRNSGAGVAEPERGNEHDLRVRGGGFFGVEMAVA